MSRGSGARPATAVILAGGDSRRLGRDKALVEIGGRPLLVRVLDAAAPAVDELLVVTGEPDAHARALREHGRAPDVASGGMGGNPAGADGREGGEPVDPGDDGAAGGRPRLRLLTDRRPGRGPLAGLETGLAAARWEACLVLACDLPFLPPEVPARLLEELAGRRDAGSPDRPRAVVPMAGGRRQSLCAAVERRAGGMAAACLDEGLPSVAAWLERLDVREIPLERLAAGHEDASAAGRWMLDVDTPEALEAARRLASTPSER